ncbi:MAG TPA: hypothetical protein VFT26_09255, partial [Pyrinomonadaceae bacterium]|nr:hypothetical protein [Pyrinomonadaceae bacterium]
GVLVVTLAAQAKFEYLTEDPMADDQKQCKNPSCTCPAQPGGKYCSASCEGAGDTIELDCDCGHDECGGNF